MSPWTQFLTNLSNLLTVKTVVTLAIVFTFCFKVIRGGELSSEFVMIASAVITYYFCEGFAKGEIIQKLIDRKENEDEKSDMP